MDLNTLLNLISGVGFPMAISIYMIMWKKKSDEENQEILRNFSLNIQENTILLKQINEKINAAKSYDDFVKNHSNYINTIDK